jgi:hypothetical protein
MLISIFLSRIAIIATIVIVGGVVYWAATVQSDVNYLKSDMASIKGTLTEIQAQLIELRLKAMEKGKQTNPGNQEEAKKISADIRAGG